MSRSHRLPLGSASLLLATAACGAGGVEVSHVLDPCAVTPAQARAEFRAIQPDSARIRFAGISRAEVDRDGRLVVLDGSGPVLFALDTLGNTTVLLDRAGPGPGELNDPRAFSFDSRGHVWVVSPNPPLIAEFDDELRHIRSLRYHRAAMVSDLAIDASDQLYIAYRILNPGARLSPGGSLVTLERLTIEGDSVRGIPLDSVTASTVTEAPFFNAPIIEYSLAASLSGNGDVVSTTTLAYLLNWRAKEAMPQRVAGCQDAVDNEERLRKSTILEGGYTMITHDIAFGNDGSLYHLTANIRTDSTQRLDRFNRDGQLAESLLIPSRRKGGTYLSAMLPTPDRSLFWGYETGGSIYLVRLQRD